MKGKTVVKQKDRMSRIMNEKKKLYEQANKYKRFAKYATITGWMLFLLLGIFGIGIIMGLVCWLYVRTCKKRAIDLEAEAREVERLLW